MKRIDDERERGETDDFLMLDLGYWHSLDIIGAGVSQILDCSPFNIYTDRIEPKTYFNRSLLKKSSGKNKF